MRKLLRIVSKNTSHIPEGGLIKKEISALWNRRMEPSFAAVVGYDRFVGEDASAKTHRTVSSTASLCQLLPALDETTVEAARREKGSLRLRSSQNATPTFAPLRRPARTASSRNSSK